MVLEWGQIRRRLGRNVAHGARRGAGRESSRAAIERQASHRRMLIEIAERVDGRDDKARLRRGLRRGSC
jgi:hypothetical protein